MTVAARREGRMYASDLPGRSCTWDTDNVLDIMIMDNDKVLDNENG